MLLLAGPSSSGKTPLAKSLQRALPDLWVFLPADVLTAGAPTDRVGLDSLDVDRRLRRGALLALTAFMDAGLNVIGEEYVWDPWGEEMARSALQGRRALVVRLRCPLAIREERERRRPIHAGFTRKQNLEWNWEFDADLVLDSHDSGPDELALQVRRWLDSNPTPAMFGR